MKKIIVFILMITLLATISSASAQLTAIHELQSEADLGQTFTGTIVIVPTEETNYDAAIELPVTWEIVDWSVTGNTSEVKNEHLLATLDKEGSSKVYEIYHFYGTDSEEIVLTYTVKPTSTGNNLITIRVIYPEGFITRENDINILGELTVVAGSQCGNNICEGAYGESMFNCYSDCPFKFGENTMVWIIILIIALAIAFIGIGYRITMLYRRKKLSNRVPIAKPVTPFIKNKSFKQEMPKQKLMPPKIVQKTTEFVSGLPPIFRPTGVKSTVVKESVVKKKPINRKVVVRKTTKPIVVKKKVVKRVKKKPVKKKRVVKKKKTVKKKATRTKVAKKKVTIPRGKHTQFYSSTMKQLQKIKKSLK